MLVHARLNNRPNSLPSVTGEADWRAERNAFIWSIDTIDSENPTGSLEFKCEGDADAFFPVNVGFVAAGSLADVDVGFSSIIMLQDADPLDRKSYFARRRRDEFLAGEGIDCRQVRDCVEGRGVCITTELVMGACALE